LSLQEEDDLKLLADLGLTINQAKIYLSNVQSGTATAQILSNTSGVGREDVYHTLPSLQDKELIIKHLSSPNRYEAIPLKDAVSILLKQKEKQFLGLKEKTDAFTSNFNNQTVGGEAETTQEIKFFSRNNPERGPVLKILKQVKNTVYWTSGYSEFIHILNNLEVEALARESLKAVRRGVKMHVILDKPLSGKLIEGCSFVIHPVNKLIKHKNFQYRYTQTPPETILILVDGKIAFIWTTAKDFHLTPFIWTNNPSLANLAKVYFNTLWEKAEKPAPSKTSG